MTAVDKVKVRTQWPVGQVRNIVFDTRQNKPKVAVVDMYCPTLGNLPLKNKLFGIRTPYYKPKAAIVDMSFSTLGNLPLKNKLFGIHTPYYKLLN